MKKTGLLLLFILICLTGYTQTPEKLKVGYRISPPFVMKENGRLSGPSIWLWEKIAEEQGLDFEYIQTDLEGLLEGVEDSSLHMVISPLSITSDRSKHIDFTSPYYLSYSTILENEESTFKRTWLFIKTFLNWKFFSALGGLSIIIFIFGFFLWMLEKKLNPIQFRTGFRGLWDGFWWAAVTMTTVGYGDKAPKSAGGRTIALLWMFTAIILISGFTATVASSLTIDKIGVSGNVIDDYKNKKLGVMEHSATEEWLKNNFYQERIIFDDYQSMVDALKKKKIDAIAYDGPFLKHFKAEGDLANLQLHYMKFNLQFYAFAMHRQLSEALKRQINTQLLEVTETVGYKVMLTEYELTSE